MSNFDSKPESFFDGDQPVEQVAREKQVEVDADIEDSQEVGRRLTEQREIKETNDRMTKIFNLVSRLIKKEVKGKDSVSFNFQFEGENLVLKISEFREAKNRGDSGTNNKDIVRIVVEGSFLDGKRKIKHDLTVMRKYGNDNFEVQYRDNKYEEVTRMGPDPRDASQMIPRQSIEHEDKIRFPQAYTQDKHPNFSAETALKELPELKEIEKMVEVVIENNR